MRLLLDTHAFLWFIGGHASLSSRARSLIEDPANQPFVSTTSLWEMAHRDPFDRLLVAQAIAEQMPVVSGDQVFDLYPIQRLW